MVRVDQARGATTRTTTVYDAEGRVTRVATPEGAVNHRHDDLGRLVRTFTGPEADPFPHELRRGSRFHPSARRPFSV